MTMESALDAVRTAARPSELRITDLRIANLAGVPFHSTIVRLDTNQGLSGYGEVRDGASKYYALLLKSRILGENPCDVDRLFRRIQQFGHHARGAGGVCGVEMALMDLAGKAYGVPAYQLAGGKFRDQILCYADTPTELDGEAMGHRLVERRGRGFRFLKMDVGVGLLRDLPGMVVAPPGALEATQVMHPFTGIQLTDRGIQHLVDYVAAARSLVGYDIPIAADHFGHLGVSSCIRLARALEPFTLAWVEDLVPWQLTEQWRDITTSIATPTCTGEDIYLHEGFRPLIEREAVRIIHPDPATSGGILETKRIGELAEAHGIGMALHMAATPIATMAAAHIGAATHNFMVLEHHAADVPFWSDLVTGLPNPLIEDGYITMPDAPGLGFTGINEDLFREHLDPQDPIYFDTPTEEWNPSRVNDRLWS